MKIGHTSSPAADAATLARANAEAGAAAARAKGGQTAQPGGATTVQISSAASELLAQADGGEFDAAKVERIKQAIASGTYTIDAGKIADKLIANAQELLDSVRR